jgi:hypothetical protein
MGMPINFYTLRRTCFYNFGATGYWLTDELGLLTLTLKCPILQK